MGKENLLKLKKEIENQFNKQKELDFAHFLISKSYDIIKHSGLFDEQFYYSQYPEVKLNNVDPIEHYLKLGVQEKCNPNSEFHTDAYLTRYEDIRNSPLHPFVHYILFGIHENRNICYPLLNLEEKYFVSIIMPTYNRRNIISKSINSVISQTFKNFELIIIDDGSDDDTDELINTEYASFISSNKIKYFKLDHEGVCAARNYGLKESKGNMIAYLDSDNQWHSNYLETMITELDSNDDYNCAYCGVNVDNRAINKKYVLSREFNRKKLIHGNFIDLNSFVHNRILYDTRGGFDENLTRLVDWDLIIRYTNKNDPLYIKKNLVNYFIDESYDNISLTESLDDNTLKVQKKYWRELYSDEYETIVNFFDYGYYLETYDDVFNSGMNPIYHFLSVGHKEGRNPNREFITNFYKKLYPAVVRNNINPFVHYIKWGIKAHHKINYFYKYEKILNNNKIHLSNFDFNYEPLVSIIILNKNGLFNLKRLFNDFSNKTNYSNFEIIVVDNASNDGSIEFLENLTISIQIIKNDSNISFSKGNNDAVELANGEYILLLDDDVEPTEGWLNEMMGTFISNEHVGAVGAKLIYPYTPDNKYSFSIQHYGHIFQESNGDSVYKPYHQNRYCKEIFNNSFLNNKKCVSVSGVALLTKKSIFLDVGGLDERYWYGYEDVDFNLKLIKKGYDIILASSALLFYNGSATFKDSSSIDNYEIFYEKWNNFIFKNVLNDKIQNNLLFTEETLNFLLIFSHDLYENDLFTKYAINLTRYFDEKQYNYEIDLDISNLDIDKDIDILISFTEEFNINYIDAKNNLIKILISDNISYFDKENNWDIIISTNKNIENLINKFHVVYIDDFSNLGDIIIQELTKYYLKDIGGESYDIY